MLHWGNFYKRLNIKKKPSIVMMQICKAHLEFKTLDKLFIGNLS